MFAIDVLRNEHQQLLRLADVLEHIGRSIFLGMEPPTDDIRRIVTFIRDYAHNEHHFKEERLLYDAMRARIPDELAETLLSLGLMSEHDRSLDAMIRLETANNRYVITPTDALRLDIIVYLMDYARLIRDHVEREHTTVYPFGIRELPEMALAAEAQTAALFSDEESCTRRHDSMVLLQNLEDKWLFPA